MGGKWIIAGGFFEDVGGSCSRSFSARHRRGGGVGGGVVGGWSGGAGLLVCGAIHLKEGGQSGDGKYVLAEGP